MRPLLFFSSWVLTFCFSYSSLLFLYTDEGFFGSGNFFFWSLRVCHSVSSCSISSAPRWFHKSYSMHWLCWSIIRMLSWSSPRYLALFHYAVSVSSFQFCFLSTHVSSTLPKPCHFASQSSMSRFLEVLRCFVSIPMIIFSLLSSRWRYLWRLVGPRGIFDRFSSVRV